MDDAPGAVRGGGVTDRTFKWSRRPGHSWQYATTHGQCAAVGVEAAAEPIPPAGKGWFLVNVCLLGNEFLFFWRRFRGPRP